MTWGAVGAAAVSVVGGAMLGGEGSSQSQQTQQQLDPRMQGLLYGDGTAGNTGLLNDVNGLRKQQLAQGGLNPMQNAGLEMQRQALMDPAYAQGYQQMRGQGASLMGQGMAGNPFSQGYKGGTNFAPNLGMSTPQGMQPQPMQSYQPQPMQYPSAAMQPIQAAPMPVAASPAPAAPATTETDLDRYMQEMWRRNAAAAGPNDNRS